MGRHRIRANSIATRAETRGPAAPGNIPAPVATVASKTDANCFGENTGAINIDVTNGTAPFSYLWSNSETTEDISNLVQTLKAYLTLL